MRCNSARQVLRTKLTTVAQLALLAPRAAEPPPPAGPAGPAGGPPGPGRVCVANTHLFFHPGAGHIRMLQVRPPHPPPYNSYIQYNGNNNVYYIFHAIKGRIEWSRAGCSG